MGVKTRRTEKYYEGLLAQETNPSNNVDQQGSQSDSHIKGSTIDAGCVVEKWKGQIEKVVNCIFLLMFMSFSFICVEI